MPDEECFERMYLNFKTIFLQRIKSGLYLQPVQRDSGRLAQLVQSICLTSRGSGVRIPHRPQHKSRSRICGIGFVFEGRFKFSFPNRPQLTTLIMGFSENSGAFR